MARVPNSFIFLCMAIIAVSGGAVLVVQFGRPLVEALSLSATILCTMAVVHLVFARARERGETSEAVERLEERMQEIDEDVGNLEGRLTGVESTIPRRTREEIDPLFAEVEVLGALVKQMAEAMADMETRIEDQDRRISLPREPEVARVTHYAEPPREIGYHGAAQGERQQRRLGEASSRREGRHEYARRDDSSAHRERERSRPDDFSSRADEPFRIPRERAQSDLAMRETIQEALEANRVDLYLQPIVILPQRRVKYYEALSRIRDENDTVVTPSEFLPEAARAGLLPRIDNLVLFRAIQVLRRLSSRNREAGLFVNISSATLVDETFFPGFLEFVRSQKGFADMLIFEFTQADVAEMGILETESLAALADIGFRFSVDNITDLKMDFRDLADRGFRFAKYNASRMLGHAGVGQGDIHPADFGDLLQRFGIELIVDHVEGEAQVLDLLDYHVRIGQGMLFSPPRPVRPEVLQSNANRVTRRAAE
ncbi:EAL domain-containing protein [Rhizobiales bacterium]|uniref:EAL domain-containing protein n=1 Tax=Hongsoonwoonella zoysiae TaxID=2821844 RepID=UPI001561A048|nr:EAL domain-containing protein [Hongsoonwoonella zoysiae]NRG19844.1 EAL domain-containing protein [Hongsoonwoonella zoysiae]